MNIPPKTNFHFSSFTIFYNFEIFFDLSFYPNSLSFQFPVFNLVGNKSKLLVAVLWSEIVKSETGQVGEKEEEWFGAHQVKYVPNLILFSVVWYAL